MPLFVVVWFLRLLKHVSMSLLWCRMAGMDSFGVRHKTWLVTFTTSLAWDGYCLAAAVQTVTASRWLTTWRHGRLQNSDWVAWVVLVILDDFRLIIGFYAWWNYDFWRCWGDFTLVEVIFIVLFVDLCTYVCVHKFLRMACNFVMYSLNCWYATLYI
jgi:hypothetical protein